jgi:hypothetical protein
MPGVMNWLAAADPFVEKSASSDHKAIFTFCYPLRP